MMGIGYNALGQVSDWHIGEPKPKNFAIGDVLWVQADGDELDYIRAAIKGIPDYPNLRVVRWFGDDARFIFYNLGKEN